jgi:hypothetical protein
MSELTFGRFAYGDWFNLSSTNYQGPLPRSPRKAGNSCLCPSCVSQGWFDESPLCRFWGKHCELCQGSREWFDMADRTRKSCDICEENWTAAVREFRDTIRSSRHSERVEAYYAGVR